MRGTKATLLFVLALPALGSAQESKSVWPATEAQQIALARTAAPPEISANASVWVERDGRFVRAVEGENGAACIVVRDHPESLYPICYDAAGARTVLPIQIREHELRLEGLDDAAIDRAIGDAIVRGELMPPERGAVAYMMSPEQILFATPAGPRVGTWRPHIMLYLPGLTAEDAGAEEVPGFSGIARPGSLLAHLIFVVKDWAKPAT